MNQEDQQLIERLNAGDKTALRILFDQYYPYLVSVVLANYKDLDLAKDVAQEIFVELWRKRETLNIKSAIKPYLRRAAINRMLNRLKAQRLQLMEELPDKEELHSNPHQSLELSELGEVIQASIEELPEKCRLIFQLCRLEGLSHKEISAQLGISTKTIENQMTKALKILRGALRKYEDRQVSILIFFTFFEILP